MLIDWVKNILSLNKTYFSVTNFAYENLEVEQIPSDGISLIMRENKISNHTYNYIHTISARYSCIQDDHYNGNNLTFHFNLDNSNILNGVDKNDERLKFEISPKSIFVIENMDLLRINIQIEKRNNIISPRIILKNCVIYRHKKENIGSIFKNKKIKMENCHIVDLD